MKKISITQIIRRLVQILAFFLYPGLFISTFHAIPDLIRAVGEGTFSMTSNGMDLVLIPAVFLLTLLWGRFFCGYLCAFGSAQDLLYQIRKRIVSGKQIPRALDRIMKYVKYAVLVFCIAILWTGIWKMPATYSPWTLFGLFAVGNFTAAAASLLTPGMLLFAASMILSFFFERFFCRYLCPLGAIFSLVSRLRLFSIRRRESPCSDCGACDRNCSMGIQISDADAVISGECIDCFQCLRVCPRQALSARPNAAVCGTAASVLILGLVSCGNASLSTSYTSQTASETVTSSETETSSDSTETETYSDSTDTETSSDSTDTETSEAAYQDGTYTGTGTGFRGETTATVTVSGGQITGITIDSASDDTQFLDRAESGVIAAILENQDPNVDAVSGATYSSNGIMEAVADALGVDFTGQAPTDASGRGQGHGFH